MTDLFEFVFILTGKEYVHGDQLIERGIMSAKEQEKRIFERACPFEFHQCQATNFWQKSSKGKRVVHHTPNLRSCTPSPCH